MGSLPIIILLVLALGLTFSLSSAMPDPIHAEQHDTTAQSEQLRCPSASVHYKIVAKKTFDGFDAGPGGGMIV